MILINYVAACGSRTSLDIENGTSVMRGAVLNGVEGMVEKCGGSAMCATYHVYVNENHIDSLETMDKLECASRADASLEHSRANQIESNHLNASQHTVTFAASPPSDVSLYLDCMSAPVCLMVSITLSNVT